MEHEPQIAPVTTLSSSSSEDPAPLPEPKRGKKRKHPNRSNDRRKKPAIDDVVGIQAVLCKASACKSNCKEQFRGKLGQENLLQFRSEWKQLHKVDQDEVVPALSLFLVFVLCCFCSPRSFSPR